MLKLEINSIVLFSINVLKRRGKNIGKNTIFLTCLSFTFTLLLGCESQSADQKEKTKVSDSQTEINTQEKETEEKEAKNLKDGTGSTFNIPEKYRKWELSPRFKYQTKGKEGKVTYKIIGNKEGFGITGEIPIKARKGQKHFWFYWGEKNIKDQSIKVMGYKKGTQKLIYLHHGEFYKEAQINDEEVNMPSNLKFPSDGIWNLLVYVNDKIQGNIVVKVVP